MNLNIGTKGIARRIAKIPRLYKLIFILVLNGVLFVPGYMFLISPQLEVKAKLAGEYDELRKNRDRLLTIKNNMPKYREEFVKVQEKLQDLLRQLPEGKDIPNLLRSVSSAGAETRVKVKYFEPKSLQNKEFFAELPFEIRYTGSYHNIAYFFDAVRRLERIVNITTFSLDVPAKTDPTSVVLEGRSSVMTYVYLREPVKEPGKDVKKEGKK